MLKIPLEKRPQICFTKKPLCDHFHRPVRALMTLDDNLKAIGKRSPMIHNYKASGSFCLSLITILSFLYFTFALVICDHLSGNKPSFCQRKCQIFTQTFVYQSCFVCIAPKGDCSLPNGYLYKDKLYHLQVGFTKEGYLKAIEVDVFCDTGCYPNCHDGIRAQQYMDNGMCET